MLRVFVLSAVAVFGLYFFEQYTGVTFGLSDVIHGLGDRVAEVTGFVIFSGGLGG